MRKASSSQSLTKMRRTVGNALTQIYLKCNRNNVNLKSEPSADHQGEEGGKTRTGAKRPKAAPRVKRKMLRL